MSKEERKEDIYRLAKIGIKDKLNQEFDREGIKKNGEERLINSFKYAYQGIKYGIRYEQNMTAQVIIGIIALILGFTLNISATEFIILIILMALLIGSELINTSIDAVVDLKELKINPIAKVAKDTVAASVLIFSFTSIICGLIIFIPKIINLFE
jgi:diacylglycerol kinase